MGSSPGKSKPRQRQFGSCSGGISGAMRGKLRSFHPMAPRLSGSFDGPVGPTDGQDPSCSDKREAELELQAVPLLAALCTLDLSLRAQVEPRTTRIFGTRPIGTLQQQAEASPSAAHTAQLCSSSYCSTCSRTCYNCYNSCCCQFQLYEAAVQPPCGTVSTLHRAAEHSRTLVRHWECF